MPVINPGFEIGNIPVAPRLAPQDFVSTGGQVGLGLAARPPQVQPITVPQQQQAQLQLQAAAQNNQINQIALQKAVKDKQDNDALDLQVQKLGKEIASTPNPDELSPFAKALYKAQLLTGTPVVYTGAQMQQVMTAAAQRQAALAQQADIAQQAQLRGAQIGQIQALTAGTGGYRSRPQVVQTGSDANGVPTYGSVSEDGTQITPIAIPNSGAVQKKNPAAVSVDDRSRLALEKIAANYGVDPTDPDVYNKIAAARKKDPYATIDDVLGIPSGTTFANFGGTPNAQAPNAAASPTATGNTSTTPSAPPINPLTANILGALKGTPGQ